MSQGVVQKDCLSKTAWPPTLMHIGHLTLLTESINKKLLVIKIVERSRSLKSKNYFWLYQIKDGIGEILKFGHRGIEDYLQIRRHQPYKQLKLNV